jgi:cancer susceptibility candidate protein 1
MALTSNALSFAWSRWNLLSGYDKLIMQFRERVPGCAEGAQQVILITPERTAVLECTEASQTFSAQGKIGD